jgi:hypothetical protein
MRKNDEEKKHICGEEKREDSHNKRNNDMATLSFTFADMHAGLFCGITLKMANEYDVNNSSDTCDG